MKSIIFAIVGLSTFTSIRLPAVAESIPSSLRVSQLARSPLPSHYPPTSLPIPSPSTPFPILRSQANQGNDLALLAKVIRLFLKDDIYQTESDIQVNIESGNTTVQSSAKVTTISQFPNKFRSEISFTKPGEKTSITTLVISDGRQVWLYRADLKQYQVVSYSDFSKHPDKFWLGFSNMIYAEIPSEARQYVAQGDASSTKVAEAVGLELKGLKGKLQTLGSQSLYVYEYKDGKEGFTFSAFVEPQTATLKQLQITVGASGVDLGVTEQILQRIANPPIAPNIFTFSPSAGAIQVKSLPIGPL